MGVTISADWLLPGVGAAVQNGAVAVEAGAVVEVATTAELKPDVHYSNAVIMPGLVNAHTHLENAGFVGTGLGRAFPNWLAWFAACQRELEFDDFLAMARLGAGLSLASGVTTVGDSSYSGAAAVACDDLGLRALVYLEVFGNSGAEAMRRFDDRRARVAGSLNDRVRLGVAPHAPYTTGADVYRAALELGLPLATHVAESPAEEEFMLHGAGPLRPVADAAGVASPGITSVRHLASRRLVGAGAVAVHCVRVDSEEVELLHDAGVAVVHCPRSNAYLGCGIAPIGELAAAGITLALGTDGLATAPSHDLFDEMRAALLLHRAGGMRLEAADVLEMATVGAASALGLADRVATLEAGKRADICVLGLAGLPQPGDLATAVVTSGGSGRVLATYVDGELRYDARTFDLSGLVESVRPIRARILQSRSG